jgi:NADH-quinone oxidoreductase subunit I
MLRCIFCGLCEEACPKSAIYLQSDKLAPSFFDRSDVIYGKDRLVQSMETIKTAKSLKSGLTTSERYADKVWKDGKY